MKTAAIQIDTERLKNEVFSARSHRNISLDVACVEIGISKPTLNRVENGKMPDSLTLLKICKWLNVDATRYAKIINHE
jgi:transcriptional regulator with XRE-family HTH domain